MRNSKSILKFSNKYEDIQHHNLLIFTLLHSPVILRRNYSPDKAQRKKNKETSNATKTTATAKSK